MNTCYEYDSFDPITAGMRMLPVIQERTVAAFKTNYRLCQLSPYERIKTEVDYCTIATGLKIALAHHKSEFTLKAAREAQCQLVIVYMILKQEVASQAAAEEARFGLALADVCLRPLQAQSEPRFQQIVGRYTDQSQGKERLEQVQDIIDREDQQMSALIEGSVYGLSSQHPEDQMAARRGCTGMYGVLTEVCVLSAEALV